MVSQVGSPLVELLFESFNRTPLNKEFLIEGENRISYGQLKEQVFKTRSLLRRLNLAHGNKLAVISADRQTVAVLYASCLMEGIATIVFDPDASGVEINLLANRVKPHIIFIDQAVLERVENLQREKLSQIIVVEKRSKRTSFSLLLRKSNKEISSCSYPERLVNEQMVLDVTPIPIETIALILFTSGTTSKPKGVVLTHGNLSEQIITFVNHFKLSDQSRLTNHLPLHHSDGLNQGPLLALATGGTWITPGSINMQNLGSMLDSIYRERATHLITVPTVLVMMDRLPSSYDDSFSSSEFCFIESTAGPLEENLWSRIEQRFGVKIVNCYGLTETVCEATYSGPDSDTRKLGSVGKPVGCEVRILNEAGNPVTVGEVGELYIRGKNVMLGYFEDEVATNDVLVDGWLKTGDLASRDLQGFTYIVGRLKSVIVRAGINVVPEEVSNVLLGHPDINRAVTVGIKDDLLGERIVSCIVTYSNRQPAIENIFEYCRENLANEKIPNDILVLDDFSYGPSGKVDLVSVKRFAEKGIGLNSAARNASYLSLQDRVINTAASIFHISNDLLNLKTSPENLRSWDSLAFLELIMAIEEEFDLRLEPIDIMGIGDLGDIVALLQQRENNTSLD